MDNPFKRFKDIDINYNEDGSIVRTFDFTDQIMKARMEFAKKLEMVLSLDLADWLGGLSDIQFTKIQEAVEMEAIKRNKGGQ